MPLTPLQMSTEYWGGLKLSKSCKLWLCCVDDARLSGLESLVPSTLAKLARCLACSSTVTEEPRTRRLEAAIVASHWRRTALIALRRRSCAAHARTFAYAHTCTHAHLHMRTYEFLRRLFVKWPCSSGWCHPILFVQLLLLLLLGRHKEILV